jgi:hypothetical protein
MSTGKTPFYLIDTSHPFYRPLGVRLAIVGLAAAWTTIEMIGKDMFWVVIAGATAVYVTYVLLIAYKPAEAPSPIRPPDDEDEPDDAPRDEPPGQV